MGSSLLGLQKDSSKPTDQAAFEVFPSSFYPDLLVGINDTKHHVVANILLYTGTVASSVLRTAEIFRPAIARNSPSILVAHNHPSGDPCASSEDYEVTRQLVEAGKVLDIEVLDHLVIGNPRYVSLKEKMPW